MSLRKEFIEKAREVFAGCPLALPELFDSYDYVKTGNCYCHPRAWGLLAKAAWRLNDAAVIELDVRFNLGSIKKFQPDIAVRNLKEEVILVVDFESPNSSDARVPEDVKSYLSWATSVTEAPEYLIITSLPNRPTPHWKLWYTNSGNYNHGHSSASIRQNPFRYWYRYYRSILDPRWTDFPISFANFNGNQLQIVDITIV